MIKRFLSGIVGIPLLVLLVFMPVKSTQVSESVVRWMPVTPGWQEGLPFILAVGVISLIALSEFYRGMRKIGAEPQEWVGFASALFFLLAAINQFHALIFSIPGVLTIFVLVTLIVELLRKRRSPIKNLGATYLGVVYVGWLFSYLVAIRSIPGHFQIRGIPPQTHVGSWDISLVSNGAWLVLYVLFTVWASDTGAYLVGRKWGKRKLSPTVSPGKSWEGWIAGLVCAVVMSLLMGNAMRMNLLHSAVIGMLLSVTGLIGDLAESSIKRDIGLKDFGTIMPGHGGILDRFDGLLFAAPIFYYYITLIPGVLVTWKQFIPFPQ